MKNLGAILVFLISINAFAQMEFEEEKIVIDDIVSVHNLECAIQLGSDEPIEKRSYTKLGRHEFNKEQHPAIEMDHREAMVWGCDLERLDELVANAMRRQFGFVDGTVTVIKRTAKEPRMVWEKCQRNYQEQIEVKIDRDLVLTTPLLGKLIPATGCN